MLSAVFAGAFGWMWRKRRIVGKELVISRLLSTPEGRQRLAAAMSEPRRRAGRQPLDVTRLKSGDGVVFTYPDAGYSHDIAAARDAGLKVGREYTVTKVDLGDWCCRIRLDGWICDFNSVQFDSPAEAGEDGGLTAHQAVVKAEVDRFLDAPDLGTRIIHGPRRSGKTHLAHVIHHERGGIVVVRSADAAKDFRWDHRRMFGKDADADVVTPAVMADRFRGTRRATLVVMDIDRKQYHEIRRGAANNRVIYLHECDRIKDTLWTTSRERGGRDIVCAEGL